jgi:hypothetical protein
MNRYSNLTVGKKLALAFGIVEVLMIALGALSIAKLAQSHVSTVDITTNWLPSVAILGELRIVHDNERRFVLDHIMETDKAKEADYENKIQGQLQLRAEKDKTYEPLESSPEETKLAEEFRGDWDKEVELEKRELELSQQGKKAEAKDLSMAAGVDLFKATDDKLQEDQALKCHAGGERERRTELDQPADYRQLRGNIRSGRRRFESRPDRQPESSNGRHRRRGDGREHQGDRQERDRSR